MTAQFVQFMAGYPSFGLWRQSYRQPLSLPYLPIYFHLIWSPLFALLWACSRGIFCGSESFLSWCSVHDRHLYSYYFFVNFSWSYSSSVAILFAASSLLL